MSLLLRRAVFTRRLRVTNFHSSVLWAANKVTRTFKLADVGEGITECEVIRWAVQTSSNIQAFDPLCEVQSDKASVEITSPFDGVIKELLVKEGEVAKVGQGLCLIEVEEETDASSSESSSSAPAEETDSATTPPASQPPQSTPRPEGTRNRHPLDPEYVPNKPSDRDILATPSIRHYARTQGVDLVAIFPGSGKDGRIEKKDVDAYLAKNTESATPSQASTPSVAKEGDAVVELGRTRYGMWKAMTKSLEIPHFGYTTHLDLTALHALLPILNANIPAHYLPPTTATPSPVLVSPTSLYPLPTPPDVPVSARYSRLTYLPFLLKTLSKAMMEWPVFRSSVTLGGAKPALTIRPAADISIAMSTPTGLYTPTIQSISSTSLESSHTIYSLASSLAHLSHLGRQTPCGLTPREMPKRGGTITISNIGAIGDGDGALPRLVEGGGVAIAALGRAKWVWDVNHNPEGARRLKLAVSWSADHRVLEGAELGAFVETWRSYVEKPEKLIGQAI